MTLSLDTSELKKVRIRIDEGSKTERLSLNVYADAAFPRICKALNGRKPQRIGVVAGPGAWSATRTGVALGNALAYAWQIPIAALSKTQFDSADPLPPGRRGRVAVVYDALPNITKKKKL